jgi:hypothetical protein
MRSRNRAVRLAQGRKLRKFNFKKLFIFSISFTKSAFLMHENFFHFYFMFKLKQKLTKILFKLLPGCEITEQRQD